MGQGALSRSDVPTLCSILGDQRVSMNIAQPYQQEQMNPPVWYNWRPYRELVPTATLMIVPLCETDCLRWFG